MADENDVLEQIPGESPAERLRRAALGMVDCSAVVQPSLYEANIIRPVDRTPQMHSAYFANPKLSTCQLAQEAAWRRAGVNDAEVTAHEPLDGGISARQTNLCMRYDAWIRVGGGLDATAFADLLRMGRGWWIDDGTGLDVHAGTCVTDAVVVDANTITVDTVEGGQWKVNDSDPHEKTVGTTAQRKYTRAWRLVSGRWCLGLRHCIAIQCAEKLPIPTTLEAASGDATGATDPAPPMPTGRSTRGEDTSGDE